MPTCVFKKCKNHSRKRNKSDGISYFHFPQNEVHRERWRKIVAQERGEEFFKANDANVVCSDHFAESDKYITSKGLRRIKKSAIPHIEINQEQINKLGKRHISSSSTSLNQQEPNVEIMSDEEGESETKKARTEVPSPTSTSPHLATVIIVSEELQYETETALGMETTQNISFRLPMGDGNVVMEQAQKEPDQVAVLENVLQCITPAVSPSTSIGSAFDSPHKSNMRKDLIKCRQLILKKNKQINTLQKKVARMKKKMASMKTAMTVLRKQKDVETDLSRLCVCKYDV
ncbi:uncharacterized protein isoform X1 [Choristoneura fumiferana]|uniref:uncharacterized protein isoform X1 n=1 Tax=Choristoneura fumiferana TaxID=7141 RepID=UPI003D15B561